VALSALFPATLDSVIRRARTVRSKARETLEERGVATLFLAVGMATWTNTRTAATPAAPLLLREATIAARGAAEEDFDLALTGEVDLNPTLLHMLAEQHQISLRHEDLLDLLGSGTDGVKAVYERLIKECAAVPGFRIAERYVLGNFSYAKLPMVQDLQANLDALVQHEVIAAIAGDRHAQESLQVAGSDVSLEDPDRTAPADEFLVLNADASQNYAINAATPGRRSGSADPHVVPVRQVQPAAPPALDRDRAERLELAQRPVDRVGAALVQPAGQQRPPRHPLPGGVAVAQQHDIQPERAVTEVGGQHPLRDNSEGLLDVQGPAGLEPADFSHQRNLAGKVDWERGGNAVATTNWHEAAPDERSRALWAHETALTGMSRHQAARRRAAA
jgi:Protein of unknown function (DUF4011)